MRVLWMHAGLLPEACQAIGERGQVTGGWVNSQLQALLRYSSDEHQFFMLALDPRNCDVQIGNVHHRSFGERNGITYSKAVPRWIEDQARQTIREFKPDIIHIHGTEYFYGRMSPDVYGSPSVPVVVSLQGIIQGCHSVINGNLSPRELFWHQFNVRGILRGETVFRGQTFWRNQRCAQEALVFKRHQHFMGRTDWDRAWLLALNPSARYYHVNETLRDPFYGGYHRSRSSVTPHAIYCSAAAGYPLKGAHVLFRAVAYLKPKYPDIKILVCNAERLNGDRTFMQRVKDSQYYSYLRTLKRRLGIEENVVGLPSLEAQKVVETLARSELFVLPSFCENSPNSLGEAQLIGVPAIATFVGGVPSVLRDNVDGRLVPSGNPAALAAMIDWFFEHPDEADAFADHAFQTAKERHDPIANAKRTLEVYQEILES